jgi:hypothetical protein
MAGTRETVVKQSESLEGKSIGDVRIHESGGQVHFHDDKNGLKCAIDVTDFYAKWRQCKHYLKTPIIMIGDDGKGGFTEIRIERKEYTDCGQYRLLISISPFSCAGFAELDKFASGK